MTTSENGDNRKPRARWRSLLRRVLGPRATQFGPRRTAAAVARAEERLNRCLRDCAEPALQDARDHINASGLSAELHVRDDRMRLTISRGQEYLGSYEIRGALYHRGGFAFPARPRRAEQPLHACLDILCRGRERTWPVHQCDRESLYRDVVRQSRTWMDL